MHLFNVITAGATGSRALTMNLNSHSKICTFHSLRNQYNNYEQEHILYTPTELINIAEKTLGHQSVGFVHTYFSPHKFDNYNNFITESHERGMSAKSVAFMRNPIMRFMSQFIMKKFKTSHNIEKIAQYEGNIFELLDVHGEFSENSLETLNNTSNLLCLKVKNILSSDEFLFLHCMEHIFLCDLKITEICKSEDIILYESFCESEDYRINSICNFTNINDDELKSIFIDNKKYYGEKKYKMNYYDSFYELLPPKLKYLFNLYIRKTGGNKYKKAYKKMNYPNISEILNNTI